MLKRPFLCRKLTYCGTTGGAEIVYFVPYEASVHTCSRCQERFAANDDDQLYRNLKSTIQGKTCPTCGALLRECLAKLRLEPLDRDRTDFDAAMRAKGYDQLNTTEEVYADFYDLYQ